MSISLKSVKDSLWVAIQVIVIIFSIIGGIILIRSEVRLEVERITNQESYLKDLASKINPYMIFDEDEKYLVDGGAYNFIQNIEIEKEQNLGMVLAPTKITIFTKNIYSNAPILSCIDSGYDYDITVERGSKNSWIYTMYLCSYTEPKIVNKFKIDIMP